jgi:hypothetical protein
MIKLNNLLIIVSLLSMTLVACNSGEKSGRPRKEKITIRKQFSRSGVLVSEISMKDTVRHGPTKNYYENGKVQSIINFEDGKRQGESIWYYENGSPYQVTPYVNGQEEGIQKKYYQSGRLLAEVPFHNGKQLPGMKEYTELGEVITGYPEIVFEKPVRTSVPGRFILKMHMSDNSREVAFEQIVITASGDTILATVPTQNGIGEIPFFADKGKTVVAQVRIKAKTRTRLKNIYITEGQYLVRINN